MIGVTTYNITADEIKDLLLDKYGKVEGREFFKEIRFDGVVVNGNPIFEFSIAVDPYKTTNSHPCSCIEEFDGWAVSDDAWEVPEIPDTEEDMDYVWNTDDSVWNTDDNNGEEDEYVWNDEELILNGLEVLDDLMDQSYTYDVDNDLPEIDDEV